MSTVIDDAALLVHADDMVGRQPPLADVLSRALAAIRPVIPYDLAVLYEVDGEVLIPRSIEGPLVEERLRSHQLALPEFPTLRRALDSQRPIALEELHHRSEEGDPYDGLLDLPPGHACMVVPLTSGDQRLGLITFDRRVCVRYPPEMVELAAVFGQLLSIAMLFARQALAVARFREQLEEQMRLVREDRGGASEACRRIEACRSPAMQRLVDNARQVARTDVPVLIRGETGVGKEVLAEAIHQWSSRRSRPFIKINCAALPANLIESELFGHVRGAFSGAAKDRSGRFRTANGGTLLLDEIGDMPLEMQAKLLRVLQEGTFEAVGSDVSVRVDVRVLAATNVDLERAVEQGGFREDLYYRLAPFPLDVPPLRERPEDAIQVAEEFLARPGGHGRGPWTLSERAREAILAHDWPGNIRELRNALERATILKAQGVLDREDLFPSERWVGRRRLREGAPPKPTTTIATWREMEHRHLERALAATAGKVYGPDGAATLLDLKPTTLQGKLRKHGIK